MKKFLAPMVIFFTFACLRPVSVHSTEPNQATPSPEEIMKRVVAHEKQARKDKLQMVYAFRQVDMEEELNENGSVKEHHEQTLDLFPIDGQLFAKQTSKDGKPLSAADQRKEEKRENDFRSKSSQKRSESNVDNSVTLDERLIGRFRLILKGEESLNGRQAYVIAYAPKGGSDSYRGIADKVISNLAGTIWIDEQEYEIVKLDARLQAEVKLGWGLLGKLTEFRMQLEMIRLDATNWLPTHVAGLMKGRKLFSGMHARWETRMSDFHKFG